jgi:hypothetical protein
MESPRLASSSKPAAILGAPHQLMRLLNLFGLGSVWLHDFKIEVQLFAAHDV